VRHGRKDGHLVESPRVAQVGDPRHAERSGEQCRRLGGLEGGHRGVDDIDSTSGIPAGFDEAFDPPALER
jgi:hypothetical protein